MSSAAATACTCTPRCRLRRTAASLNSALYSWTFFGPARGTRHLPLLGGSVYKSEAGSPASFKRLLGSPALRQRQDVPIGVFEPCYLGGARRPPDPHVVLLQERIPLKRDAAFRESLYGVANT